MKKYKKPEVQTLKQKLTPLQFQVTQNEATEPPFDNTYWDNHADGIYIDIVSGEPLFSSLDKFDSGCGWPSFSKPLPDISLTEKSDMKLAQKRIEVRSYHADSHLGHVFNDGPMEYGGLRYCINSASIRFIPLDEMQKNGFGEYLFLFADKMSWEIADLAGGCFWGVQELFRQEPGVATTRVGYTGGDSDNPTYEQVKTGQSGHAEAIEILFNPKIISFESLLLLFFKLHDPTSINQQGNDLGSQYRSAIFYRNEVQAKIAKNVIDRIEKSKAWKKPIVTEITEFNKFWSAEEFHQDYLQKNPNGYTCHFFRKINF